LTERGRELVAKMEQRGIVVDLAHASPATIRDVLALVRKPPIVSHTASRRLATIRETYPTSSCAASPRRGA